MVIDTLDNFSKYESLNPLFRMLQSFSQRTVSMNLRKASFR